MKSMKELLNEDNFGLQRDLQGGGGPTLAWAHCLEYECQMRKEALKLCFQESYPFRRALWSTSAVPQHRMKHWNQVFAVATSRCISSDADKEKVATLEGKVAELEKEQQTSSTTTKSNQGRRPRGGEQNWTHSLSKTMEELRRDAANAKQSQGTSEQRQAQTKARGEGKRPPVFFCTSSRFDELMASDDIQQKLQRRNRTSAKILRRISVAQVQQQRLPETPPLRKMQHSQHSPH